MDIKPKRISIKWRIFLCMVGFCVALLAVLWTFQIVFLENFYKMVKTLEIRAEASEIGNFVLKNQWDQLYKAIISREDLYVEVWAPNVGSIFSISNYRDGIQANMSDRDKLTLFMELRNRGTPITQRYFTSNATGLRKRLGESIMYSDILEGENGNSFMLTVSANITPVNATVDTLRYQIYLLSVVMIAAAVLTALALSRRIIKPIVRLNAAAGELAEGNYDAEFRAEGYSEISRLADTLTRAAKELGRTENLRKELIANVSHDLRTPLTLITGYGEMMRDIPGENTPENMQVIVDEAKRLTSLVNDMLDLSKMQSNVSEPSLEPMDLTGLISDILLRVGRMTEKDHYDFTFEAEDAITVLADKTRISQVVYNLVTNAMNYTGPDKKVLVRQLVQGDRVTIQVIDNGEGIDPENLPYVWDRYFKVDKVHKRAATGTGLGLSIVKSTLSQHPGVEYGVESTVGVGSNFWFRMPIESRAPRALKLEDGGPGADGQGA